MARLRVKRVENRHFVFHIYHASEASMMRIDIVYSNANVLSCGVALVMEVVEARKGQPCPSAIAISTEIILLKFTFRSIYMPRNLCYYFF